MKKEHCRPGMIVRDVVGRFRAVVIKCNPRNARVRTVDVSDKDDETGALWDIPYSVLEPVYAAEQDTEMTMRSFEDPDNEAIKQYFKIQGSTPELPDFPDGSPEVHIMQAICELWRRLDDENLERECAEMVEKEGLKPGPKRRPATIMRDIQGHYADMINKLFSALGREIPKAKAERWEKDRKQKTGTI